jgi:hypothetical protein
MPDETPTTPPREVLYAFYVLLFCILLAVFILVGVYT